MTEMDWAVVRCMDGRLNQPVAEFLKTEGIPDTHDLISIPGGARDLNDFLSCLFRAVEDVSLALHHVENIVLIQHTDCGAYGGRPMCGETEEADYDFQMSELKKAGKILKQAHPDLKIRLALAHIRDDGSCMVKNISS